MDKKKPFSNLFYFKRLCKIGGTEQFLYEIAKKYHKYDLTVMYDDAELEQLIRLKKLVRCIKRDSNKTYYAKKAFFNFNIDCIDRVVADEYIFVCHAIYQELGYRPPIEHPKIQKIIGVSDYAVAKIIEQEKLQDVDKPVKRVYNPLTLEKPDKVVRLISASRLDDKTKGGERTLKLIEALDRYCEQNNWHYIWTIYSNTPNVYIQSPNVVVRQGRADIRPYIADSDWLVQLSNNMESYCYSIQEALGYGVRVCRTPLTVCKEFDIPKSAETVLDWDCGNIDKVVEDIFAEHEPFKYTPPKDGWNDILERVDSDYVPQTTKVLVQPIQYYFDLELNEHKNKSSEPFYVSLERARTLFRLGYVAIVG